MPRRDGTGPNGMGSRSGRGLGVCTDVTESRFGRGFGARYGKGGGQRARNGFGQGLGFRGGRSNQGTRWWGNIPASGPGYPEAQESLEERAAFLEAELKAVHQSMAKQKRKTAQ